MRLKRMNMLYAVLTAALLAAGVLAGCSREEAAESTGQDVTQDMDQKIKVAMIVHDTSSPFQAFFKAGGEDAAEAHNIDFTFMGTSAIDIPKQVSMFENAIQGGYDGIAVTIFDQKAFEKGINTAEDRGIAVVSFNIDGDWGERATLGYSGADEFLLGYEYGKYFFDEVMEGEGTYILCPAIADLQVLVYRMDGIQKAAAEHPGIELLTTVEIGTDLTKAFTNVENAYAAHPEVDAFIGTDFFSESMANFISKNGLAGEVYGACIDITPGILKYLKEGSIQCIMGQNPYLQGYYAVTQLWLYLAHGINPVEINTGTELVTPENMGPYLDYYDM
jgi:ABC-type sugar transport system substrate-binding protein